MNFKEVNKLPIDVKETIKKRISTRSFLEKSLTDDDKNKLMNFYNTLTNPFGVNVRVQYISKETGLEETPSRRQDWIMGITIFLIQSIQIADIVGELLWFGLNGNGYM